ncbi:MAG: nucleoside kinase [Eubacterium sp.]|nr:nucleoside kinase [Eubacterium sp.]
MFNVKIKDKTIQVEEFTSVVDIANEYKDEYEHDIVLAMIDGKLAELSKSIEEDCTLEFLTTADKIGSDCYRRSVVFMMLKAIYKKVDKDSFEKVSVNYSLQKGLYCEIHGDVKITEELLETIKTEMKSLNERDLLIAKNTLPVHQAIKRFEHYKMKDKVNLFKYRRSSRVNIYNIGGFEDYFYGYMAYSTGILKYFELTKYKNGFVLRTPDPSAPTEIPEFIEEDKHFEALNDSTEWAEMMGVPTIGDVNNAICDGSIRNIIMVQEAYQEKKIGDIASDIASRDGVKFVLIAGPSASGKTSFANRLSVQLVGQGLKPHLISVDNYFVDRKDNPVDEDGNLDYEVIEALDLEGFNRDMEALLNGEEVELPEYDFDSGTQRKSGKFLKLEKNDVLVIEGIHCLNEKMTYKLDADRKYKIYISALTPLRIDEHNRISASDWRLLRRLVRDLRTRSKSAQMTIEMWHRVRRGEEKNIFPYEADADAIFNSAMIYEPSVLKVYTEPTLFSVVEGSQEYLEANRLLKFLDYVLPLPEDDLPKNSIMREFIGGSSIVKE